MTSNPVDEIQELAGEPKQDDETVSEYVERVGEAADVDPEVVAAATTYVTGALFAPGTPDGEDAYRSFCDEIEPPGQPPGDGASGEESSASDDEPAASAGVETSAGPDAPEESTASDAADAESSPDGAAVAGDDGAMAARNDAATARAVPGRVRRTLESLPEPTRRQAVGGAALLLGGAGVASLYAGDGLEGLFGETPPSTGPAAGSQLVVGAGERVVLTDARSTGSLQWEDGGALEWHDGASLTLGGGHE